MKSSLDFLVFLILTIILIVGSYQFYFLPQKYSAKTPQELYETFIDKLIKYNPKWVWVYSGLYYPGILGLLLYIESHQKFTEIAFSFMALLFFQLIFFYLIPVKTPKKWRENNRKISLSEKFLAFVQDIDKETNCFPSMHTSVATMVSFHFYEITIYSDKYLFFTFPFLIGISCLYTKQHYFIDILAGALLGSVIYYMYGYIFLN